MMGYGLLALVLNEATLAAALWGCSSGTSWSFIDRIKVNVRVIWSPLPASTCDWNLDGIPLIVEEKKNGSMLYLVPNICMAWPAQELMNTTLARDFLGLVSVIYRHCASCVRANSST